MIRTLITTIALTTAMLTTTLRADENPPVPPAKDKAQAVQRFRDMKFGLFVHWGPGVISGEEISWSRRHGRRGHIPENVYDNYYKKFTAEKFNADEWAQVAADAGMKYLVFTTKHHDGFCHWDTSVTDYKSTSKDCPFGRDTCKELAAACKKKGIVLGWYFSQRDWHDADFENQNYGALAVKIRKQIEELCTHYGDIGMIWFDAKGPFPAKYWDGRNLFKRIYELQPGALINDRCGLPGDFATSEYRVGGYNRSRLWESCIPIGAGWSWKPPEKQKTRTYEDCMNLLIRCAGSDGNLLLNVGPHPDGNIIDDEANVLRRMGAWLKQYGSSIYGTRGGPYPPADWGVSTCKDTTLFLHVQHWPESGPLKLPALKRKIVSSSVLTGGKVTVAQTDASIEITVDEKDRKAVDTVIELTLDGAAFDAK